MKERPRSLSAAIVAVALAVLTFVAWSPAGDNGFVDYDDGAYVTKNHDVSAGLTSEGVVWAFTSSHSANWHPLTWLSHMLDCELFGLEPRGHHLMAVGIHALNAALCLLAILALTRRLDVAVVVAALFAWHPQRVESVAWIAERKDVLSGTFFFLTLMAYARYARLASAETTGDDRKRARRAYAVVALTLALGLMAKQMLVTVPMLLLVLDAWPLGRWRAGSVRRLVLEKVPLLALALAAGVVTLFAQSADAAIRSTDALSLGARIANAFVAYVTYLEKTFVPTDLAVFYPHEGLLDPDGVSLASPHVLGCLALLVVLTVACVALRRSRPALLVGWLWFLGTLVPVIGIVQVGGQWMADRYAYLTLLGVYLALAHTALDLVPRGPARLAATGLGVAAAAAFVPMTRAQIAIWHDTRTLFEHALRVTDHNTVAHVNLGYLEHNEGNLDAAEEHYLAAIEISPNLVDTYSNLGAIHLARADYAEAEYRLEQALEVDPGYSKARMLLGLVLEEIGEPDAALREFRAAVRDDPDFAEAAVALTDALVARGDAEEAQRVARRALERHPNAEELLVAYAGALSAGGDAPAALAQLERASRRTTVAEGTRVALVWMLATAKDERVRDGARALELSRQIDESRWEGARAIAAAHACAGNFAFAASVMLNAMASAPKSEYEGLRALRRRFEEGKAIFE